MSKKEIKDINLYNKSKSVSSVVETSLKNGSILWTENRPIYAKFYPECSYPGPESVRPSVRLQLPKNHPKFSRAHVFVYYMVK